MKEDSLLEPKTKFQETVRLLAEAAMSVTHHDASETEPGYIHEVNAMERRFVKILRAYLSGRRPRKTDETPLDGAVVIAHPVCTQCGQPSHRNADGTDAPVCGHCEHFGPPAIAPRLNFHPEAFALTWPELGACSVRFTPIDGPLPAEFDHGVQAEFDRINPYYDQRDGAAVKVPDEEVVPGRIPCWQFEREQRKAFIVMGPDPLSDKPKPYYYAVLPADLERFANTVRFIMRRAGTTWSAVSEDIPYERLLAFETVPYIQYTEKT